MKHWPLLLTSLFLLLTASLCLQARTFRQFQVISKPSQKVQVDPPAGFQSVDEVKPVEPNEVRGAVEELIGAWNDGSGQLGEKLAPKFYDRQRLVDSRLDTNKVPFDAKVSVLGISNIQTLNQFKSTGENGREQRLSYVSADVRTQILFDSPTLGFQRIEGTNEYLLEITQETF